MKKCFHILFLICVVWYTALPLQEAGAVAVGDSQMDVQDELGSPGGWVQRGEVKIFLYDHMIVEIENGQVIKIEKRPQSSQGGYEAAEVSPSPAKEKPRNRSGAKLIKDFRNGGKKIKLSKLLVEDEITVVAFYADW